MSSHCAIVGFYSPCGYELPRLHLQRTVEFLVASGTHVVCLQVCGAGQKPVSMPRASGVTEAVFHADHALWLKEALWNLGASMTDAEHLFFFDCDVYLSATGWVAKTLTALESHDLIQPFEWAVWLSQQGVDEHRRRCSSAMLADGKEPLPAYYHPGFAWCVTRSAFQRFGGWYERHPVGGSDTAFVYSLDERWTWNHNIAKDELPMWKSPSFVAHQRQVLDAKLKVGFLPGVTAFHRWHGTRENREYMTRCTYLPEQIDGEYPLRRRHDGLLEWSTPEQSEQARRYFAARLEDG